MSNLKKLTVQEKRRKGSSEDRKFRRRNVVHPWDGILFILKRKLGHRPPVDGLEDCWVERVTSVGAVRFCSDDHVHVHRMRTQGGGGQRLGWGVGSDGLRVRGSRLGRWSVRNWIVEMWHSMMTILKTTGLYT